MKILFACAIALSCAVAFGQGHDLKPAEALKQVAFLQGDWKGKQEFNTGGAPMSADVIDHIDWAIGGRYLEESLAATVTGRPPSSTRHFLTYDPTDQKFKAWWFNDSSYGAMELDGDFDGKKLVLTSKPTQSVGRPGSLFRATYEKISDTQMGYGLELKMGDAWQTLFHTVYTKQTVHAIGG